MPDAKPARRPMPPTRTLRHVVLFGPHLPQAREAQRREDDHADAR